jgi:hypothetical protein
VTAVDDLLAFLRAQMDAEAELAHRLGERYRVRNSDRADDGQPYWPLPSVEANLNRSGDPDIAAGLDLIKLYNPQRVLAEVEANRDLIGHIEGLILYATSPNYAHGGIEAWANRALTMLAQPHAGRQGWREEWRA